MTMFLEEPLYVLLICIPLALAMLVAWVKTTRIGFAIAGAAFILLAIVGVVIESIVETDREAITSQLEQIALDVQSRDIPKILEHIHSGAVETRRQAESNLQSYTVRKARVTKIHEIVVRRDSDPAEADVKLNAVVDVDDYRGAIAFTVTLRWEDDRWKVAAYQYHEPLAHMRNGQ